MTLLGWIKKNALLVLILSIVCFIFGVGFYFGFKISPEDKPIIETPILNTELEDLKDDYEKINELESNTDVTNGELRKRAHEALKKALDFNP